MTVAACATYEAPPGGLGYGGEYSVGNATSAGNGSVSGSSSGGSASGGSGAGVGPVTGGAGAGTGGASNGGTATGGSAGSGGGCGSPDCCPDDPDKTEPGACGCGVPETAGCGGGDTCPDDPDKTEPGTCGCGVPDADTAGAASCTGLIAALTHRYDFEGTGTVVTDRKGTSHGTVVGATLAQVDGHGAVTLAGGASGPYVNLPNDLLPAGSVTLEAWVTWGGGNAWQRVFDFGDTSATSPEDMPANGKSYLFLTAMTDTASGGYMRAVYSLDGGAAANETRLDAAQSLPIATLAHVAVVVDDTANLMKVYLNGENAGEVAFSGLLSGVNDVNVWLGRSQYNADPEFTGTFHEFRIYGAALSDLQIAASFAGGPDPAFLAP